MRKHSIDDKGRYPGGYGLSSIKAMSTVTNNSPVEPNRNMVWCGSYTVSSSDRASDGLHGRINIGKDKLEQIGANAGDKVRLIAEANSEKTETERKVHQSGRSITLPATDRKKLALDEGDQVKLWIELSRTETKQDEEEEVQETLTDDTESKERYSLKFQGEEIYHYIDSADPDETVCGVDLTDRNDYRSGKGEPGSLLDPCIECRDKTRSSESMTNKELAEWIGSEVGFEVGDTSVPSYFDKEQLVQIRDCMLNLKDGDQTK